MPYSSHSNRICWVKPAKACLAAQYPPMYRVPNLPASDPIFTTTPCERLSIGKAAWLQSRAEVTLTSIKARSRSGVRFSIRPRSDLPTQLTKTSITPTADSSSSKQLRTASASVTSTVRDNKLESCTWDDRRSRDRSMIRTRAESRRCRSRPRITTR